MTVWFIFAGLTLATLGLLLWPLLRQRTDGLARRDYDLAVYRAQLAEIDAEASAGKIGAAEADSARLEVKRRMLRLGDATEAATGASRGTTILIVAVAVLVPAVTALVYGRLGSPALPDQPLAARFQPGPEDQQIVAMIERLKQRLAEQPNDARGWLLLGRTSLALDRYAEAITALRRVVALTPDDPAGWASFGEALTLSLGGEVSPEAQAAFERALALDPNQPAPQYYLGLAAYQDGRPEDAYRIWSTLLAASQPDAAFYEMLRDRVTTLAQTLGKSPPTAPTPTPEQQQQQAMVNAMVERLAERLKTEPDDFDGWMRLGRARTVLGEKIAARDAYAQAVRIKPADPEALFRLGEAAAAAGDRDTALKSWTTLKATLTPGSADYQAVDRAIATLKNPG